LVVRCWPYLGQSLWS